MPLEAFQRHSALSEHLHRLLQHTMHASLKFEPSLLCHRDLLSCAKQQSCLLVLVYI